MWPDKCAINADDVLRRLGLWHSPPIEPSKDRPWHRYDEWPEHNGEVLAMLENGKYVRASFDINTVIWSARGVVAWQYLD